MVSILLIILHFQEKRPIKELETMKGEVMLFINRIIKINHRNYQKIYSKVIYVNQKNGL